MSEAFNPGFPVHVYHPGMELPTEGTYYLIAGNGMWLHKDTGIVKAFIAVKDIPVLEELDADFFVECNLPKLPLKHVWRIKEFFRRVVQKYHAEAETTLYYRKSDQSFKIHVPTQHVSHGGVSYNRVGLTHVEGMEDYLRVGTIHSHCDFNAFHSGTDVSDEKDFDGLHCTFGHNDKDEFSISASIVVNGVRKKVDPEDVLEGISICPRDKGLLFNQKREDFYKIEDLDSAQWSVDVDQWMGQVTSTGSLRSPVADFWNQFKFKEEDAISSGDQVEWVGNLNLVSFRNICGDGPFEVSESKQGKLTIVTNVGLAEFDEKLFKKVE